MRRPVDPGGAAWWAHLRGDTTPTGQPKRRGRCWVCNRDIAIRKDARPHSHKHPTGPPCPGSAMFARPAPNGTP